MKNKEKQLLLQDLCARLPYKQKVYYKIHYNSEEITETLSGCLLDYFKTGKIAVVKPYLRPMSSMTEEEAEELDEMNIYNKPIAFYNRLGEEPHFYMECNVINVIEAMQYIDWLNAHYFDFRGLISMGLALEAPEGMYNN